MLRDGFQHRWVTLIDYLYEQASTHLATSVSLVNKSSWSGAKAQPTRAFGGILLLRKHVHCDSFNLNFSKYCQTKLIPNRIQVFQKLNKIYKIYSTHP